VPWKDISCPWAFPVTSLCLLAAMRWETLVFHAFCHNVLPHHRPKIMEPVNHRLKSLKLWAKINPSSLKLFSLIWSSQQW
jgi:hypothetical protein